MSRDVGRAVVNSVFTALQVDDEWSKRGERSFTWWPYRLAQSVAAGRERRSGGLRIVPVTVKSNVLVGIDDFEAAETAANRINRTAGLSAVVVNRSQRSMDLVSQIIVYRETAEMYQGAAKLAAATQIAEAESIAPGLAAELGASVAASAPPGKTARPAPDDMLNLLESLPSMGRGGTGLTATDFYTCSFPPENVGGSRAWVMATPQPDSVTIELPFVHEIPVVYLMDGEEQLPAGTVLLVLQSIGTELDGLLSQLDQIPFERRVQRYGPGLGVYLSLPIDLDEPAAVTAAALLNRLEVEQCDAQLLGAWHSHEPATLAFSGYLPAALFHPLPAKDRVAMLLNMAFVEAKRVRWAAGPLHEHLEDARRPLQRHPLFDFSHNATEDLIRRGESHHLEFKSSARWDYREGRKNKDLETAIVKTIAGFMNSDGGTLLIGVDDDGTVLGLQPDLELVRPPNLDGFENWLVSSLLTQRLGGVALAYLSVSFDRVGDLDVCNITIQQSREPVFSNYGKDDQRFYIRTGNSTNPLKGSEVDTYVRQHFGEEQTHYVVDPTTTDMPPEGPPRAGSFGVANLLKALTVDGARALPWTAVDYLRHVDESQRLPLDTRAYAVKLLVGAFSALERCCVEPDTVILAGVSQPDTEGTRMFFERVSRGAEELGALGDYGERSLLTKAMPAFEDGLR
ncbi:MAG: ATP-binding protein, partial [Actinobacteria bacterium]|nr:ATP-binding protein [Actinomycetota bacterium]